jgi:hypothetical protein
MVGISAVQALNAGGKILEMVIDLLTVHKYLALFD